MKRLIPYKFYEHRFNFICFPKICTPRNLRHAFKQEKHHISRCQSNRNGLSSFRQPEDLTPEHKTAFKQQHMCSNPPP